MVSDTKSIGLHHVMSSLHSLTQAEDAEDDKPKKWMDMEGKVFDRYDIVSFLYGWIVAL